MGPDAVIRVRAMAKINLSLRVVGVRRDGYHDLRTIYQSIALHDTLTVRIVRGPFRLECNDPACPSDRSNLVWRAAEEVWAASGRSGAPRGFGVRLTKRIPLGAGLGGGSSDAAAMVRVLGSLLQVDDARLREVAVTLGADVPYFLEGGTVLGLERGDRLFPLIDRPTVWVTLVIPDFAVSSKDAYEWWDGSTGLGRPRPVLGTRGRHRASAWARGGGAPREGENVDTIAGVTLECGNDLQAPVSTRHPEIARIVGSLERAGAACAAMSGSGSAVFGVFPRRQDAERVARACRRGSEQALVTRTVNRAAYQRLARLPAHRINSSFAPRSLGHS